MTPNDSIIKITVPIGNSYIFSLHRTLSLSNGFRYGECEGEQPN